MIRKTGLSIVAAMALSACTTNLLGAPVVPEAAPAPASATALSPQALLAGECGLFLWTQTAPRNLLFFSRAQSNTAIILIDEQEATYAQSATSGDIFGQFMTDMTFAAGGTDTIRVELVPGDILVSGQRTQSATLFHTNVEGWETIIPVRGARVCQAE